MKPARSIDITAKTSEELLEQFDIKVTGTNVLFFGKIFTTSWKCRYQSAEVFVLRRYSEGVGAKPFVRNEQPPRQ